MKRLMAIALCLSVCFVVFTGCSRTGSGNHLWLEAKEVDRIEIQPMGMEAGYGEGKLYDGDIEPYFWYEDSYRVYERSDKIRAIVNYLNSLDFSLADEQEQQQDSADQETFVISLTMKDGTERTFYHRANRWFKEEDGAIWLKMSYLQGSRLDSLIWKYDTDEYPFDFS